MRDLRVVTWRVPRVGARDLERVTLPDGEDEGLVKGLASRTSASGGFYLATCQRVVVVVSTPLDPAEVADAVRAALAEVAAPEPSAQAASTAVSPIPSPEVFVGTQAFRHLAEVAASLDSLVPGEAEVLGQMKQAFNQASNRGLAGSDLKRIMPAVLRTAKRVRHRTELGRGKVSLIPLTLDLVDRQLTQTPGTDVYVIGTGVIGRRMLEFLKPYRAGTWSARLHVVSRTKERAEEIAAFAGATAHGLEEFLADPPSAGLLVLASRSRDPFFSAEHARGMTPAKGSLLVLDLAMPRNAEESVRLVPGVTLVQLDDLSGLSERSRAMRERALHHARQVLDEEVRSVRVQEARRGVADEVVDLRRAVLAAAESRFAEARDACRRSDGSIDEEAFRRWFDRTVATLLHVAVGHLKRERVVLTPEAVDAGEHGEPARGEEAPEAPS